MDVYVYGDESGTFDSAHNAYYTFGGLAIVDRAQKDEATRRYIAIERAIAKNYPAGAELKATMLSPRHKMALYRATRHVRRFACVIEQESVDPRIMANKKIRQRYLDFAFKESLKSCVESLKRESRMRGSDFGDLLISFDKHKTATLGRYELQELIASEFKDGIITHDGRFINPRFPEMGDVKMRFVDSRRHALVRASDIIANVMLHKALEGGVGGVRRDDVLVTLLP